MRYRIGTYLTWENSLYIIGSADDKKVVIINLMDGRRRGPYEVKDSHNITEEELKQSLRDLKPLVGEVTITISQENE